MNIIERGRQFVQSLRTLAQRSAYDWRRCPRCQSTWTERYGGYSRRPMTLAGRQSVYVPRHLCHSCGRSYSEQAPALVPRSWYGREVHRLAVDSWLHMRCSLRRTAEWLRSWIGHQERWQHWCWFMEEEPARERCALEASTVQRWLDRAGVVAEASVPGQLEGIAATEQAGADGLWARLRGGVQRVVLLLTDSVSGLLFPPVVVKEEESAAAWGQLMARAQQAGLKLKQLSGLTSDGAQGLLAYLRQGMAWVHQQRCHWHLWRNLWGEIARLARAAVEGLAGEAATTRAKQVREELTALLHGVLDAPSEQQAEEALAALRAHAQGPSLAQKLWEQFDLLLAYVLPCHQGLQRVSPEWHWRDFRLRLSHGRNHGSEQRLERAALVWAIYHNFTPAQWRCERKRHYRHPGQSSLEVAGASPGEISYLDALNV